MREGGTETNGHLHGVLGYVSGNWANSAVYSFLETIKKTWSTNANFSAFFDTFASL